MFFIASSLRRNHFIFYLNSIFFLIGFYRKNMMFGIGFEPMTRCLEVSCSIKKLAGSFVVAGSLNNGE
ncbi:MAG: hypothetical protein JWQ96_194 [Segetibacter sp.]|nr:hypothetical protein [Segetibacter sp.]